MKFRTIVFAAFLASLGLTLVGRDIRLQASSSGVQTPPPAGRHAQPPLTAAEARQLLDKARASKAAGQAAEALTTASSILKRDPAHAGATEFVVGIQLEQGKVDDALKTYDGYVAARKRPDGALLSTIAK